MLRKRHATQHAACAAVEADVYLSTLVDDVDHFVIIIFFLSCGLSRSQSVRTWSLQ